MDRLDAMKLFVRLVECGSFSAVGREANIGQPAVSKQIAALEQHLGTQLVLRTSRQVVITESGQALYDAARPLLDHYDAVESSVGIRQRSPRGLIKINTAPGHGRLCITPLLPAFFKRYPDIVVDVSASERQVDLVGEGVDLAVRHGRLVDSSLTARHLTETEFVLAASPAYLAERGTPRRLSDMDKHTCVVFARGGERRPWALKKGQEATAYVPHGSLMTGDAEHIRAAVLHGVGIAQVPFWLLASEIRSGAVEVLMPELQPEKVPVHLVYPAGRRVPARVRALIDYLVEAFADYYE
jgi:DNA-binding transcriptional LysR family regulator